LKKTFDFKLMDY